jgi:hypothetical protein
MSWFTGAGKKENGARLDAAVEEASQGKAEALKKMKERYLFYKRPYIWTLHNLHTLIVIRIVSFCDSSSKRRKN